jgi:hypothetical protein
MNPTLILRRMVNRFRLREKYRKIPLSLHEGWGSESNLPMEEKIFVPDKYLSSPRTILPYYGSLRPRTSSDPDMMELPIPATFLLSKTSADLSLIFSIL